LRRIRTQAEWNVETHMIRARPPTSDATRSRISAAALLVKVIARMEPGCALRWEIVQAIRRASTRVLPEPAPATTSSGPPSWVTAERCAALRPSSSSSADGGLARSVPPPGGASKPHRNVGVVEVVHRVQPYVRTPTSRGAGRHQDGP
jgi:hypothetical protein